MGIPDYPSVMLPVLLSAANGATGPAVGFHARGDPRGDPPELVGVEPWLDAAIEKRAPARRSPQEELDF